MKTWGVPLVAVAMALTACAPDPDPPNGFPPPDRVLEPELTVGPAAVSTPTQYVHQYLDRDCPQDPWDSQNPERWMALAVQTSEPNEVNFLDDLPACAVASGRYTWLHNRSTAVWTVSSRSGDQHALTPSSPTLTQLTFAETTGVGPATLLPGAAVVIDAPPDDVQWTIDLPGSFAWEAHTTVTARIEAVLQGAAETELRRQTSAARVALAQCTLSVATLASGAGDLQQTDPAAIVNSGLSGATAGIQCQNAATQVRAGNNPQAQQTLANDLQSLETDAAIVRTMQSRLKSAQQVTRLVMLVR